MNLGRPQPPGALPGAVMVVTDRRGGASTGPFATLNLADHVGDTAAAVAANRAAVAAALGVQQVAVMRAAHGNAWARAEHGGQYPGVDILISTDPGVAVLALAADCGTIALSDPVAHVVAAVHSGWRGVVADAAGAAVAALEAHGARADRIVAHLGPAICGRCYEVGADVRDQVLAAAGAGGAVTRSGTPGADIRAAITAQLRRAGVTSISADDACTLEDPDLFSYRRDRHTGRHGLAVRPR